MKKLFTMHQKTAYLVVISQCLPALHAQLEGMKGYWTINTNQDIVKVLKLIWGLCCRHDQNTDHTYAVVTSLKGLLYFYQKPNMTSNKY